MRNERPLEEWEYPEPDSDEDEDDSETRPCPSCQELIYEDAERCPVCGHYVQFSSSSTGATYLRFGPWWFIGLGLLGIVAVMLTLILGG